MTLRLRFMLLVLLATGTAGGVVARQGVLHMRQRYQEAMEEALVDMSQILAAWISVEQSAGRDPLPGLQAAIAQAQHRVLQAQIYSVTKTRVSLDATLTDKRGIVVWSSLGPALTGQDYSRWNDIARTLGGTYGARSTRSDITDERTSVLHVAAPILIAGSIDGVLSVSKPVDAVGPFLAAGRAQLLTTGLGALVAVGAMAAMLTWWFTRPLRRLVDYVRAVRGGARIAPPALPGEMAELAKALDGLGAALDGRTYIERYIQTLTHEMKAPLTALRGAAEILSEKPSPADQTRFLGHISDEVARLHDLVDRLLQLAALERRDTIERTAIDVHALMNDVIAGATPLAERRSVTLIQTATVAMTFQGEPFLVRQAIANLVLNAVEFAPAHSAVTMSVALCDLGIQYTISDRGPGIPPWAQGRVRERFFSLPRPDSGRKGTGLGLCLVQEVAALHGGQLELRDHPAGGTIAVFTVPVVS